MSTTFTSDEMGGVSLQVPTVSGPFDGYFELVAPELGLVPMLWTQLPYPGSSNDVADYFPFYVMGITTTRLQAVVDALRVTRDVGRGDVFVMPYDCDNWPAGGVTLALDPVDPSSKAFYLDSGGNASATSAETTVSTASGPMGGFINVAPGPVTIVASVKSAGVVSRVSAVVRAGAVTLLEIVPTPP
jgi:hypothetical protein